tara:strand:- start:26 stop:514 length:489 start_codon:yes stop_codon:yes gene_type:complete
MIHGEYGQPYTFYTTTEEKRIDRSVPSSQIRFLFKLTNNMDQNVVYSYGQTQLVNNRYTRVNMTPSTTALQDVFTGKVNFLPNGYWSYEIYEVSWQGSSVVLGTGTAPINETDVLSPAANTKGVVQGLIELGKLYIKEPTGSEEVQYESYTRPAQTNYVYVS